MVGVIFCPSTTMRLSWSHDHQGQPRPGIGDTESSSLIKLEMSGLQRMADATSSGIKVDTFLSTQGTPKTPRKSIFSSEPKSPRTLRMNSRDSLRSPAKRQDSKKNLTPPTPRRTKVNNFMKDDKPLSRASENEYCDYEEIPKLPLPPLADTLAQYLDNVKPIVNDATYAQTKHIVDKFGMKDGVGEKVMLLLEDKRQRLDNWAYDYWLNDMYLNCRLPLPVNSNPGMVFPRKKFSNTAQMLSFTARLVQGFIRYKIKLDKHALVQDRAASRELGQPLCMEQYYRILTTYRKPGKEQDQQLNSGPDTKEDEHIVVGRKGYWYSIPVKATNKWSSVEDVFASLMDVWENAENSDVCKEQERVAYLTSSARNIWAEAYNELTKTKENETNLKAIADAMLIVCLDEETQNPSDTHRSMKDMFRQMLTGSGSRCNGSNRWYDKTVQLVICPDGVCGLCYEHSSSEGIAVVQLLEGVLKELENKGTLPIAYHPSSVKFHKMEWTLDENMKNNIETAILDIDKLSSDNDLEVFHYNDFGKDFIKSCRCSPDAWLQMSLQLTMFKLVGNIVPTYESASTRRFRQGRVDSIRASHPEALAWCKSMQSDRNKEDRRKLFELAMKKQTKVMVDNILGNGLDIPLLGLREGIREAGLWDHQDLFTHESYSKVNTFTLSTSQVPISLSPSFMGYGAVVPDGYGVSYNPYPDSIIFCICSFHSSQKTNSRHFTAMLHESLRDMKMLFMK